MKKILISLMAIALVIGLVGAGAFAYFSDVEQSTGNSFTAGTLDLGYTLEGTGPGGKVTPTGVQTANGLDVSVAFSNLAPGDSGTITWILTNSGSLPGTLNVIATRSNDVDGVDTEPELILDGDPAAGELDNNMTLTTNYLLNGASYPGSGPWTGPMTNVLVAPGGNLDSFPITLPAGAILTIQWAWSIDGASVGNIIQGDTFTIGLAMSLDQ